MAQSDRPVLVGLHPSIANWVPEAKYAIRALLRVPGYPVRFVWSGYDGNQEPVDLYYGPLETAPPAHVRIRSADRPLYHAELYAPEGVVEFESVPFLQFEPDEGSARRSDDGVEILNDAVFGAYWLLTGATEPGFHRDRWGNLSNPASPFATHDLGRRPPVSLLGTLIGSILKSKGLEPRPKPWASSTGPPLAISHDVDYPEIIRWIECLRGFGAGPGRVRRALDVLGGKNHFWVFPEWMAFEERIGARSAFYFMTRRGSLPKYLFGMPDAFYDIRSPRFQELFRTLRDGGWEIGLHASFEAYTSAERLEAERLELEAAAACSVTGLRHHYWHLDPDAPNETLRRHQLAGFEYDSSLGFEFYPGYRRGVCQPFQVFDVKTRRELDTVQVPPSWMDDHFVGRTAVNGIEDPDGYAAGLVDVARETGGTVVIDYHVRGMNGDFFPGYGPWLERFAESHLESLPKATPNELASSYRAYADELSAADEDAIDMESAAIQPETVEVRRMLPSDTASVARLHAGMYAKDELQGESMARMGAHFLDRYFYQLNGDNPYFFCDVAVVRGVVIGFFIYTSHRGRLTREGIRRHPLRTIGAGLYVLRHKPRTVLTILSGLRYTLGNLHSVAQGMDVLFIVLGAHYAFRGKLTGSDGPSVARRQFEHMEATLRDLGHEAWYGAMRDGNDAVFSFIERMGATIVGTGMVQGLPMTYVKKIIDPLPDGPEQRDVAEAAS